MALSIDDTFSITSNPQGYIVLDDFTSSIGLGYLKNSNISANANLVIKQSTSELTNGFNGANVYTHKLTPTTTDYIVKGTNKMNDNTIGSGLGIGCRVSNNATTGYFARLISSASLVQRIAIYRYTAGAGTLLVQSGNITLSNGTNYDVTLQAVNNAGNVDLTATVVPSGGGTTTTVTFNDTIAAKILTAGYAGILAFSSNGHTLTKFSADFANTTAIVQFDEFLNNKVFQINNATGNATIALTGQFGGTMTSIEWRTVIAGTSTEVNTWTALASQVTTANFFKGNIILPKYDGMLSIQIRFSNNTGITYNSTNKIGAGQVVYISGQSNGANMNTTGTAVPARSISSNTVSLYYNYTTKTYTSPTIGDGATSLMNTISAAMGCPVVLANLAVGGTTLLQRQSNLIFQYHLQNPPDWLPATAYVVDDLVKVRNSIYRCMVAHTSGTYFENDFVVLSGNFITYNNPSLLLSIPEALKITGNPSIWIWDQGETDGIQTYTTKATYKSGEQSYFNFVRNTYTGIVALPIISNQLAIYNNQSNTQDSVWQQIKRAKLENRNELTNIYWGAAKHDLSFGDEVHLNAVGYATYGTRMGKIALFIYQNYYAVSGLSGNTYTRGPKILSTIKVSATQIDVTIAYQGTGTDFTPTTGITGFIVSENGTPLTISSAARINATTIRLTTSTSMTGTIRVDYIYGVNPTITSTVKENGSQALPLEWDENSSGAELYKRIGLNMIQ